MKIDDGVAHWDLKLVKNKDVNYNFKDKLCNQIQLAEFGIDAFNLDERAEEICGLIILNGGMRPVGIFKVSHGSVDELITHPRAVLKRVLLCNGKSFALVHNHPDGDCSLSEEDVLMYLTLRDAAEQLGLECVDIIATGDDNTFQSAREEQEYMQSQIEEEMEREQIEEGEAIDNLMEAM